MSSSVYVHSKKRGILIFSEGSTQGLDDTRLTAEKNIQPTLLNIIKSFV